MGAAKIAVTLDEQLVSVVDRWVKQGKYPNRSKAIQAAVRTQVEAWRRTRLIEELEKMDPAVERAEAEEWYEGETWPG